MVSTRSTKSQPASTRCADGLPQSTDQIVEKRTLGGSQKAKESKVRHSQKPPAMKRILTTVLGITETAPRAC
jgi:hypothetical protein